MNAKTKAIFYGILAILIVVGINFSILYSLNFPFMAIQTVTRYWVLISLLIGGFGLQVGLFSYFKTFDKISSTTTITSGGISSFSMILCCSHYLLNILPFLGTLIGISALTSLSRYTLHFLWIGIFSNLIGIGLLLYQNYTPALTKHHEVKKMGCCGGKKKPKPKRK